MKRGVFAAVAAYALWGILPVYWKALQAVPALEILGHRTVWSLVFVLLLLGLRRQWGWLRQARRRPRMLLVFGLTTCLLGANWFTYIWAVNSGHVVDSSLGYFINPLFSVLLGVLFLGERLRPGQAVAIVFALAGVLFLTVAYGAFPWIALTLAGTFGLYGLLRKTAPLGSLEGLGLETALLSVPTLAYLLALESAGSGSFGHAGAATSLLLAGAGVVTAFPLLMFAYAARNVTLATVGILQYIAPTLQFLLGVLVYGEPFNGTRLVGFAAIWAALALYSAEGLFQGHGRDAAHHAHARN
ncbi:MAG: EamA family transporter RarD [Anaerolineae bacterium]